MERREAKGLVTSFIILCVDIYNKGGRVAMDSSIPYFREVLSLKYNGVSEEVLNISQKSIYNYLIKNRGCFPIFDSEREEMIESALEKINNDLQLSSL